jgi:hypothetical protein
VALKISAEPPEALRGVLSHVSFRSAVIVGAWEILPDQTGKRLFKNLPYQFFGGYEGAVSKAPSCDRVNGLDREGSPRCQIRQFC